MLDACQPQALGKPNVMARVRIPRSSLLRTSSQCTDLGRPFVAERSESESSGLVLPGNAPAALAHHA